MIILEDGTIIDTDDDTGEEEAGAEAVVPSAIRIQFTAKRGQSFAYENDVITGDMVATDVRAADGIQGGDWTIQTMQGSVTITGRILSDGLVEMVLCTAKIGRSLYRTIDVDVTADFKVTDSAEFALFSMRLVGEPEYNLCIRAKIAGIKLYNKTIDEGMDIITPSRWNQLADMSEPYNVYVLRGGMFSDDEVDSVYDPYSGTVTFYTGAYTDGTEYWISVGHSGRGVSDRYGIPLIEARGTNPVDVKTSDEPSEDEGGEIIVDDGGEIIVGGGSA